MLILLAAMAQAAPALAADPTQAALLCRAASVIETDTPPTVRTAAHYTYFTMIAARIVPGDGTYFEKMAAVPRADAPAGLTRANARQVMAACDQRFPLARRRGPVTLPAGAYERDLMCSGLVTVVGGLARGYRDRTGDSAPYDHWWPLAVRFQQSATAGMAQRGITDGEAPIRAVGPQMFASLDIGNAEVVAEACEAQLGR